MLIAEALAGLPEIKAGDDLAELIVAASDGLREDDVLVVAHKVISKSEGRIRDLADVTPGKRACELAAEFAKDARHVQVILDESEQVLRAARGVLICLTRHGFVCANAGVDRSNAPREDVVVLLPSDPDASARALRARIGELTDARPGVIVTDSFGRAWRHGQCDVAIGCAGIRPLEDWRGLTDAAGRELSATWIAAADELAGAADLVRSKDGLEPVVRVRGGGRYVTAEDGPGATALVRPEHEDLFR
jgi:coenzyme F420-0:L-glutamate ligase/coenzyme F420-1:gamma-L-glutamate ligase